MSLYKRKDKAGGLVTPVWYCEFEDRDESGNVRVVRKSTGIEIETKSAKAEQRSKDQARKAEALIRKQYFEDKKTAAAVESRKSEITFDDWAKRFLELAKMDYQAKPNT